MVIFLNQDGSAQKVVPERIFQGTNNVIAIDVIAPYAPTTALEIAFTLPNREQTSYMPMTYVTAVTSGAITASAWEYVLQSNVTEYEGTVLVSINAISNNGNKTSYAVSFNVERSILPDLPPAPTPDVYQLLLQYVQQNSINIIKLDKRMTDLENIAVRKVLRDFTVNDESGEGIKYYSDGTTATVQFPTGGGTAPTMRSEWLKVITFSESDFNADNELAFSPQQTGFDNAEYLALLDRSDTADYEEGGETVPAVHNGFWQTANSFFKGTNGSIYMQFNKPFSGRLVLLGGAIFSNNFIMTVDYDPNDGALVFTKVDGTTETIYIPQLRKVLRDFTVNTETGEGVKYYSDGTTASIQFPTDGTAGIPQSSWIKVLTFSDVDFNANNELAFSPQQTGFDNNKYLALLDRLGSAEYDAGDVIVPTVHNGFWQTANTFFKGSDGSIYMQFNKPFSGRLILLGGVIETIRYVKDYTVDDWQGSNPNYTISVPASVHGRGQNPVIDTGMQVFNTVIRSDGTVVLLSTRKEAFKLIIL